MTAKKIAVIDNNLFFSAKLRESLRNLGLEAEIVLPSQPLDETFAGAVINLSAKGLDAVRVTGALKKAGPFPVIGFGRHTDEELLRQGREAGCDPVVTNGRLFSDLAGVLKEAGIL